MKWKNINDRHCTLLINGVSMCNVYNDYFDSSRHKIHFSTTDCYSAREAELIIDIFGIENITYVYFMPHIINLTLPEIKTRLEHFFLMNGYT